MRPGLPLGGREGTRIRPGAARLRRRRSSAQPAGRVALPPGRSVRPSWRPRPAKAPFATPWLAPDAIRCRRPGSEDLVPVSPRNPACTSSWTCRRCSRDPDFRIRTGTRKARFENVVRPVRIIMSVRAPVAVPVHFHCGRVMSSSTLRFNLLFSFATVLAFGPAGPARGQQEQAVLSGIQYLRGRAANQQVGETAMIALALIKADTPKTDPVLTSVHRQDPEAVHQQRIRPGAEGGARHLRGGRRGDGPVQPGERGQPRRARPGRQLT